MNVEPGTDLVIAKLDLALLALCEATTIPDVKRCVDIGVTAEVWAKQQKLGDEITSYAHSFTMNAQRKLGEILKKTTLRAGEKGQFKKADSTAGTKVVPPANPPSLADLGLSKKESSKAQKLASLPEKEFELVRDGKMSLAKAVAAGKPQGKATKEQKAEPKKKKEKPAPPPEDDSCSVAELGKALEASDNEVRALQLLVESLKKDDLAKEVAKSHMKYDQLEGRLHLAIKQKNEAEAQAKYSTGLLRKIREALKVQTNGEILQAIRNS